MIRREYITLLARVKALLGVRIPRSLLIVAGLGYLAWSLGSGVHRTVGLSRDNDDATALVVPANGYMGSSPIARVLRIGDHYEFDPDSLPPEALCHEGRKEVCYGLTRLAIEPRGIRLEGKLQASANGQPGATAPNSGGNSAAAASDTMPEVVWRGPRQYVLRVVGWRIRVSQDVHRLVLGASEDARIQLPMPDLEGLRLSIEFPERDRVTLRQTSESGPQARLFQTMESLEKAVSDHTAPQGVDLTNLYNLDTSGRETFLRLGDSGLWRLRLRYDSGAQTLWLDLVDPELSNPSADGGDHLVGSDLGLSYLLTRSRYRIVADTTALKSYVPEELTANGFVTQVNALISAGLLRLDLTPIADIPESELNSELLAMRHDPAQSKKWEWYRSRCVQQIHIPNGSAENSEDLVLLPSQVRSATPLLGSGKRLDRVVRKANRNLQMLEDHGNANAVFDFETVPDFPWPVVADDSGWHQRMVGTTPVYAPVRWPVKIRAIRASAFKNKLPGRDPADILPDEWAEAEVASASDPTADLDEKRREAALVSLPDVGAAPVLEIRPGTGAVVPFTVFMGPTGIGAQTTRSRKRRDIILTIRRSSPPAGLQPTAKRVEPWDGRSQSRAAAEILTNANGKDILTNARGKWRVVAGRPLHELVVPDHGELIVQANDDGLVQRLWTRSAVARTAPACAAMDATCVSIHVSPSLGSDGFVLERLAGTLSTAIHPESDIGSLSAPRPLQDGDELSVGTTARAPLTVTWHDDRGRFAYTRLVGDKRIRTYPYEEALARVLGVSDVPQLAGLDGMLTRRFQGRDVTLSVIPDLERRISLWVQEASRALDVRRPRARRVMLAIVLDYETGEVLAAAETPTERPDPERYLGMLAAARDPEELRLLAARADCHRPPRVQPTATQVPAPAASRLPEPVSRIQRDFIFPGSSLKPVDSLVYQRARELLRDPSGAVEQLPELEDLSMDCSADGPNCHGSGCFEFQGAVATCSNHRHREDIDFDYAITYSCNVFFERLRLLLLGVPYAIASKKPDFGLADLAPGGFGTRFPKAHGVAGDLFYEVSAEFGLTPPRFGARADWLDIDRPSRQLAEAFQKSTLSNLKCLGQFNRYSLDGGPSGCEPPKVGPPEYQGEGARSSVAGVDFKQMVTHAVGYGMQVNPLWLAALYGQIANDGQRVMPRWTVEDLTEGDVPNIPTLKVDVIQNAMAKVVTDGTGKYAGLNGLDSAGRVFRKPFAGKTGTMGARDSHGNQVKHHTFVSYQPAPIRLDKERKLLVLTHIVDGGTEIDATLLARDVWALVYQTAVSADLKGSQ